MQGDSMAIERYRLLKELPEFTVGDVHDWTYWNCRAYDPTEYPGWFELAEWCDECDREVCGPALGCNPTHARGTTHSCHGRAPQLPYPNPGSDQFDDDNHFARWVAAKKQLGAVLQNRLNVEAGAVPWEKSDENPHNYRCWTRPSFGSASYYLSSEPGGGFPTKSMAEDEAKLLRLIRGGE